MVSTLLIAGLMLALAVAATGLHITKGFVTTRFVRLALVAAGTTPSITYTGQLNP